MCLRCAVFSNEQIDTAHKHLYSGNPEFRWLFSSPGLTVTTHGKHWRSLMPFHSYRENEDVRAIVLIAC